MLSLCPFNKQFQGNQHFTLVKNSVENMPSQVVFCYLATGINEEKADCFLVFVSSLPPHLALLWDGRQSREEIKGWGFRVNLSMLLSWIFQLMTMGPWAS